MIKVLYIPSGNHAMAVAGERLLERLHAAGAAIESVCKGNGACGTCIVEVQSGGEWLSPCSEEEREMVRRRGGTERCRLSCQTALLPGVSGEVRLTQPVLRIARAERERARRALARVDWDCTAAHPIASETLQEMMPYWAGRYGDVSADHFFARRAREAVEAARARAARSLGAAREQVRFLSGWQELALGLSILRPGMTLAGPPPLLFRPMAVLGAGRGFSAWRFDAMGRVDPDSVAESLERRPFVFFGSAVEGLGTRLPAGWIAGAARSRGVPFGMDLSWTFGVEEEWRALAGCGAEVVTLSPGLFGGPRGILVAVLPPHVAWPIPEMDVEPALAVGAARALSTAATRRLAEGERLSALRDRIEAFFLERFPGCEVLGDRSARLPQTVCLAFCAWNADGLAPFLETMGVSVCGARADSRVDRILRHLGHDPLYAAGVLSIWLGHENTEEEFAVARDRIGEAVKSFRAVTPTARPGLMPGTERPEPRTVPIDGEIRAAMMDGG